MIESRQNKLFKQTVSLQSKKERDKLGLFIVEGERLVSEIPEDWETEYYMISDSFYKNNRNFDLKPNVNKNIVADSIFKSISDTVSPQGILAVCKQKSFSINSILKKTKPLFLILEKISDPGNLGTMIRTADAAGADAVILSEGCVDLYNSKVIRSTMGSVFHLPIYQNINLELFADELKKNNVRIFAAHLDGINYHYNVDLKSGAAVLIGNEANGLTAEITKKADELVKIPLVGKAESINASVACGILIYEAVRQRL